MQTANEAGAGAGYSKADFHPCSYGYRPQRSAKIASMAIREDLYARAWGVVEIDFRSYFTTIPHDKLMILIKQASRGWEHAVPSQAELEYQGKNGARQRWVSRKGLRYFRCTATSI